MELFSALGLDVKVFIAQIVNFCVLGLVLYFIGYKPILKFVKDRTNTIDQGVKDAATAKESLAKAEAEHAKIMAEAKAQANTILDEAKQHAVQQGNQLIERSQQEAQKLLDKARQDIHLEHDKMVADAKNELAAIVVLATEKLLHTNVNPQTDQAFIEKTLAEVQVKQNV